MLVYARYSTEDQNPRSIDGPFRRYQQYLDEKGIVNPVVTQVKDRDLSSELAGYGKWAAKSTY